MKAFIIGLGGAGSRITDILYEHDRRSGTNSVLAVAIDTDLASIKDLNYIPHTQRIVLPMLDDTIDHIDGEILDVAEMIQHIQQSNTVEIDAVIICSGLGGRHADAIPLLVEKIRDSFYEPVVSILTLPMRDEGRRISAAAADQIEAIEPVVDGCIIFDNETWYRKIATELLRLERTNEAGGEKQAWNDLPDEYEQIDDEHLSRTPLNPRERNDLLNERIARRFGLLLRAGEFVEGGRPVAEVVLDAGEVINTISGMGMVAIGYATEMIPKQKFSLLNRLKRNYSDFEEGHLRASRVVELAKRAIYQEISVPCDLTSADKALILIAGPSEELSMKGFQNVRKWIDRSISGLEMRAGDYPVLSTKYVGVIVVLAGIKNIPRINELKEIRDICREEEREERMREEALRLEQEQYMREKEEMERIARERAERAALLQKDDIWDDEEDEDEVQFIPDEGITVTGDDHAGIAFAGDEPGLDVWNSVAGEALADRNEVVILPERGETQREKKLSLPGRQAKEVADISRQTAIGGPVKPNDRSMDAGAIRMKDAPVERGRYEVDPAQGAFSLPSMVRARDDSFEAKTIALKSHFSRPRDTAFEGGEITVRGAGSRPNDDALIGRGRIGVSNTARPDDSAYIGRSGSIRVGKQPAPNDEMVSGRDSRNLPRPRDEVKSRSRFVVIGGSSSTEQESDDDDDGITWI
jgi:cell division GTPase FtsZ